MNKWAIRLIGDARILDLLCEIKHPNLTIIKKSDGYYLESSIFDGLETHYNIRKHASKIISALNGTLTLLIDSHGELNFDFIVKTQEDGTETIYGVFSDRVCMTDSLSIEIRDKNGKLIEKYNPLSNALEILEFAVHSDDVFRVLNFLHYKKLNKKLNWTNLYKIFEIIEKDVGGTKKLVELGWTTKKKLERFKHTANSPTATGDEARHAIENTPPSKPMQLNEAINYIKQLVMNWINFKMAST